MSPAAGGAELFTHQVALRLVREGHEVTVLTSRYPGCLMEEQKDGVTIVRKGNPATVYLEGARFFHTRAMKRWRHDIVIDAINTMPFFSPLYAKGAFVIALVYQLTGEIFLKEFGHPLGHLLYTLERRSFIPWYLEHADHVVTLSPSTKAELLAIDPELNPDKIAVIPPGVDHDDFRPGHKSHEPLVLFINRLVEYKQPDHVIKAMKEVCVQVANAKLVMVGTPLGAKYATSLKNLVRLLGLESRVDFVMSRPFLSDKVKLLQRAWVHILPSVKEGFGISILEAAACGTPTVGYDVAGVRDAVVQNRTGLLATPGNTRALASNIVQLLTDGKQRRRLAEQAEKWACSFRWDKTADKFIEIMKRKRSSHNDAVLT